MHANQRALEAHMTMLTRDVLDRQLLDRRGIRMGRVDGIVLQLREGEPPRVAYLESGGRAPWRRLGRRMAGWVEAIQKRLPGGGEPTRIPWAAVLRMDANIAVSLDATRTPEMALELWLREHVIAHIPWS